MRSFLSDFEITNTAELEAHINMNATAARANFEKHYADRLADPNRSLQVHKRRLDVSGMADVNRDKNLLVVDLSSPTFDYASLDALYLQRLTENGSNLSNSLPPLTASGDVSNPKADSFAMLVAEERREEMKSKLGAGDITDEANQLTLSFLKCDYVNVDKVVKSVIGSAIITRISFANSAFSDDECDDFATLIKSCKSLKSLDLSGNKIGSEGLSKIVDAFIEVGSKCPVVELNLGGNDLSKAAATHLARLLVSPGCTIRVLLLAGNKLGIYGAEEIGRGIGANTSLASVSLQNNNLGTDGFERLINSAFPLGATSNGLVSHVLGLAVDANRIDDSGDGVPQLLTTLELCTRYNERRWAIREWIDLEVATRGEIAGLRLDEVEVLHAIESQCRAKASASSDAKRIADAATENEKQHEEAQAMKKADDAAAAAASSKPTTTIAPLGTPATAPSKASASTLKSPPAKPASKGKAAAPVVVGSVKGRAPSTGPKKVVVAAKSISPTRTVPPPKVNPLPPKPKATPVTSTDVKGTRGTSPSKPAPKRAASKSPMKKK